MPTARHGWGKVSLSEVKARGGAWTGTCVCGLSASLPRPRPRCWGNTSMEGTRVGPISQIPPAARSALPALRVKSWPGHTRQG